MGIRVGEKRGPLGEELAGKCGELGWRGAGDHILVVARVVRIGFGVECVGWETSEVLIAIGHERFKGTMRWQLSAELSAD